MKITLSGPTTLHAPNRRELGRGPTLALWNSWPQGSLVTYWPCSYSSRQMGHGSSSSSSCSGGAAALASCNRGDRRCRSRHAQLNQQRGRGLSGNPRGQAEAMASLACLTSASLRRETNLECGMTTGAFFFFAPGRYLRISGAWGCANKWPTFQESPGRRGETCNGRPSLDCGQAAEDLLGQGLGPGVLVCVLDLRYGSKTTRIGGL